MKPAKDKVKRATIMTLVASVGLALAGVPSHAAEDPAATESLPMVTITDQPGAPGEMLRELDGLTEQPLGELEKVLAFDDADQTLSIDQLAALVAGEEVDGVRVLGVMPGSQELLDTTMADLTDGSVDGGEGESSTSTLMFVTAVPESRDWCLTMCIASGKTVWECIRARMYGDEFLILDMFGGTTLAAMKEAFERANGVSLDDPEVVETLVGEGEPSEDDIRALLAGRDVESLQRVAALERPDLNLPLADVAEESGVIYAKTILHIFTFRVPFLGLILAVCKSEDGGKTWKCVSRQWDGF